MTERLPWLSVLVPVYRAERYLRACVASVTGQAEDGIEILLLDDASPDGSGAVADALQATHPQTVRVFRHTTNRGVSVARNRLIAEARGAYVWLLDADDILLPGAIAALREVVRTQAPDLVLCDFSVIDAQGRAAGWLRRPRTQRTFAGGSGALSHDRAGLVSGLMRARQLHAWSKIGTRALWSSVRFPEGRAMMEDAAVVPSLVKGTHGFVHVAAPWVGYRRHDASALSTIEAGKLHDLIASVRDIHAEFAAMDGLDAAARFSVDYFCLRMLAYAARRADRGDGDFPRVLRGTLQAVFPGGIGDVLAQGRRHGWWLRNRRMVRDLRRTGALP